MIPLLHLFLISYYNLSSVIEASPLLGEGSRLAVNDEFPFVVALRFSPQSKYVEEHRCGGALITRTHVLTAAHCFDELEQYSDLEVRVGSVNWQEAETFQIKDWIAFMNWAKPEDINEEFYYDVGIITLQKSVSPTIGLAVITGEDNAQLYNKKATTAGWGLVENNESPKFMKAAEMRVLAPKDCPFDQDFPSSIKALIPKLYFCSKGERPVKTGSGDSGSPLFINGNEIIAINGNCWPSEEVHVTEYRIIHPTINFYKNFILSVTDNNAIVVPAKAKKPC